MNANELKKHLINSLLTISSGTFFVMYIYMLLFKHAAFSAQEMSGLFLLIVTTNFTQIVMYAKKRLSKKAIIIRYTIIAILAITINLIMLSGLGFMRWDEPATVAYLIVGVFAIGFVLHHELSQIIKISYLETSAFTDALTGAYNRRYFMETADSALENCVKDNRAFALIMFDLDHFKAVNDTYGHAVGDEVLKIAVARTRSVLKSNTLVARIGGEEFVIMIADLGADDVMKLAWRIQNNIESSSFYVEQLDVPVTASFGVAVKPQTSTTLKEIMENADKALYQAKSAGRNTVVLYDNTSKEG